MVEAVETMDGWFSLHDLRKVDWAKWKLASKEEQTKAIEEFKTLLSSWDQVEKDKSGSHCMYHIVGQKADLIFIILRPTMKGLAEVETHLNKTKLAEYLIPAYSHLSVVELSKYAPQKDGVDPETLPEIQARLKPILPKYEHISFYPMNRKREGDDNWFTLEKNKRSKLLYEHSLTGRKYAGKVKQIITGSVGLDKWEWGVTLFAHDALQLKKIVYEMRFDTATSRYGEFGEFFIGNYLANDDLNTLLEIS
ncbi:hydrogen peroxide-dependent heme synthase [Virgibacillus soli]|uniref:Coproheme decarboxylase n=1 Tax=Paracerasibacillus soli TaxID=480284 RepID=A0ABU5CMQ6_9BACI|nr:hydrogen peroxide-dependent heme synthase [Virgibacillus soli]MDY0407634.1 hydrogen peroxide-dependent heme synthase [Virgibacillus soli]